MSQETIKFDENGNFIFDAELESQWMELHRDIQNEYRAEKRNRVWAFMACVGGAVSIAYLGLMTFAVLIA